MSENNQCKIVAHVDMDCFYVQVERGYNPSLKDKAAAVVQYNPFGDLKTMKPTDNRIVTNGSIIAVSYEARAKGVKRTMRGAEAKKVCPEIILVQVPTAHGKADLTIYREAGDRVVKLLCGYGCKLEKASIDEVYLDLTQMINERMASLSNGSSKHNYTHDNIENTHDITNNDTQSNNNTIDILSKDCTNISFHDIIQLASKSMVAGEDQNELQMSKTQIRNGHHGTNYQTNEDNNMIFNLLNQYHQDISLIPYDYQRILCGAAIVNALRQQIHEKLGYTCSGGIAHCKILAKIASGMHKPNQQTLVPSYKVHDLMGNIPISRIPGFGGKFGEELSGPPFYLKTLNDIKTINKHVFIEKFNEDVYQRIMDALNGIDSEEVKERTIVKSLACGKSFRYSNAILIDKHIYDGTLMKWLNELSCELYDRIQNEIITNHRKPKLLTVHIALSKARSGSGGQMITKREVEEIKKKQIATLSSTNSTTQVKKEFVGEEDDNDDDEMDEIFANNTDDNQNNIGHDIQKVVPSAADIIKSWKASTQSVSRSSPSIGSPSVMAKAAFNIIKKILQEYLPSHKLIKKAATSSSSSSSSPTLKSPNKQNNSTSNINIGFKSDISSPQKDGIDCISYLCLTGINFEDVANGVEAISNYFQTSSSSTTTTTTTKSNDATESSLICPIISKNPSAVSNEKDMYNMKIIDINSNSEDMKSNDVITTQSRNQSTNACISIKSEKGVHTSNDNNNNIKLNTKANLLSFFKKETDTDMNRKDMNSTTMKLPIITSKMSPSNNIKYHFFTNTTVANSTRPTSTCKVLDDSISKNISVTNSATGMSTTTTSTTSSNNNINNINNNNINNNNNNNENNNATATGTRTINNSMNFMNVIELEDTSDDDDDDDDDDDGDINISNTCKNNDRSDILDDMIPMIGMSTYVGIQESQKITTAHTVHNDDIREHTCITDSYVNMEDKNNDDNIDVDDDIIILDNHIKDIARKPINNSKHLSSPSTSIDRSQYSHLPLYIQQEIISNLYAYQQQETHLLHSNNITTNTTTTTTVSNSTKSSHSQNKKRKMNSDHSIKKFFQS